MRPWILITMIAVACGPTPQKHQTSNRASLPKSPPPAAASLPDASPRALPPAQQPPPFGVASLEALTRDDLRMVNDAIDDVAAAAIAYRKAIRKWDEESTEGKAMRASTKLRDKLIERFAKERGRKSECLVVIAGRAMEDAAARGRSCGADQWAIDKNGITVGGVIE